MQDNSEAGASPALVERALEDCRTWQALPDANGAAHVLAAEVERLRGLLALHDSEDATTEAMLEEVQRSRAELDTFRGRIHDALALHIVESYGVALDFCAECAHPASELCPTREALGG